MKDAISNVKAGSKDISQVMIGENKICSVMLGDNLIFSDLKKHMLGYYNVKEEGVTNESLAENPKLTNLAAPETDIIDFRDLTYEGMASSVEFPSEGNDIFFDMVTYEYQGSIYTNNLNAEKPLKFQVYGSNLFEDNMVVVYYTADESKYVRIYENGIYTIPVTEDKFLKIDILSKIGGVPYDFQFGITQLPSVDTSLQLKNFTFGGLSGIGSYTPYFSNLKSNSIWNITSTGYKLTIISRSESYSQNETAWLDDLYRGTSFKVKVSNLDQVIGSYPNAYLRLGTDLNRIYKDGEYQYIPSNNASNSFISIKGLPDGGLIQLNVNIEILPEYENSLVFNGTAKNYVYNSSNIGVNTVYATLSDFNKIHIHHTVDTPSSVLANSVFIKGTIGEPLSISVPSYKIRITGLNGRTIWIGRGYSIESGTYKWETFLKTSVDNTYVIPAVDLEVVAAEDAVPTFRDFRIGFSTNNNEDCDITIEFLPSYPLPSSPTMYGQIDNLPESSIKCMMMDVTPFGDISENWMYCQRKIGSGNTNYAIVRYGSQIDDTATKIAYSVRNRNGTYINGKLNKTKTALKLLQCPQVIAVNCSEPSNSSTVMLSHDISPTQAVTAPQMALRSLILFDRELTTEEMKWVMDNLMGFEETNNDETLANLNYLTYEEITDSMV